MPTVVDVNPSATILTQEEEEIDLQVIEATVETSRWDEAATVEMETLAVNATREEINDVVTPVSSAALDINGVRVGSGLLTELTVDETGMVTVKAVDAIRRLDQAGVGHQFTEEPVTSAFETIFSRAQIEPESDDGGLLGRPGYNIEDGLETPSHLIPEGGDEGTAAPPDDGEGDGEEEDSDAPIPDNPDQGTAADPSGSGEFTITRNFNEASALEALNSICEQWNWYWYVDENNVVQIVDELEPTEHTLEYVTETTAGLQTPPYRQVVVIGGPSQNAVGGIPTDGDGGDGEDTGGDTPSASDYGNHILSTSTVQGIAGSEPPTYRYRDPSIRSAQIAQNVAVDMLRKFMEQRATGSVTIVGDPTIRPLDVITMPESMGGEQYIVSDLLFELSNSDGFTTEIGVGGLVDPAEIDTWQTTGPDSGTAAPPGEDGTGDDFDGPGDDGDDTPIPSNPDDGTAGGPGDGDGGDGGGGGDSDDDSGPNLPDGPGIISP